MAVSAKAAVKIYVTNATKSLERVASASMDFLWKMITQRALRAHLVVRSVMDPINVYNVMP